MAKKKSKTKKRASKRTTRRSSSGAARKKSTRKKKSTKKKATRKKRRTTRTSRAPARRSGFGLDDDAIEQALVTGEQRDLLEAYFGEQGYDELRSLASRASSRAGALRGGPRVLLLPGIMGSKLGRERLLFDDVVWVDPIEIGGGGLSRLTLGRGGDNRIEAVGVILLAYLKLKLRLKMKGFDASFHAFDWRRSLDTLGTSLARRIRRETQSSRDVSLVAHSMGGLVSRSALSALGADADKIRRIVMLGTPNHGSFVPVQALRGTHDMVRKMAALDLRHTVEELIEDVFGTFPGLYQMLPWPEKFSTVNLYDAAAWPDDRPRPRASILRKAPDVQQTLASGDHRFTLIAGINQQTTIGVQVRDGTFVYTRSFAGDGTVPLAFAQLDDVPTYYVEESHGSLPNNRHVARAVGEILETGKTSVLPDSWSPRRRDVSEVTEAELEESAPFEGRRGEQISAREVRNLLSEFAASDEEGEPVSAVPQLLAAHDPSEEPIIVGRRRQHRIDLRLVHGSIANVDARALVLGVFRGVAPSGAARAIDARLGYAITDFTERHMFSGDVGEIFIMPAGRHSIPAEMVVFVGMGSFDEFDEEVLRLTAEHVARTLVRTKVEDFATVLMGSGSGAPLGETLANMVEGFFRGLQDVDKQQRIRAITLCEYDDERYGRMRTEIMRLATTSLFDEVEVTVEEVAPVDTGVAAPAIDVDRAARPAVDPVYLFVRRAPDPDPDAPPALQASMLTAGGAATVVVDVRDIDEARLNGHLERIEMSGFTFGQLEKYGTDLAELVLPDLVASVLQSKQVQQRRLVVIHDATWSRIPWELIMVDGWSPSAGMGLTRKYAAANLSVAKWLDQRRLTADLSVLLVVNPTEDLDGAEAEGDRVGELLAALPATNVEELRGPDATRSAIRAALGSGEFDAVHYAGHAFFDPVNRARSGILCNGGQVLSGADLAGIERLPALMFFNACEAGRVRSPAARAKGKKTAKRLETNIGLAEAFLRGGVANYIGTYWPVSDAPAKAFAEKFYGSLLAGALIGDALLEGRRELRDMRAVDWADYIHYGSPSFVLKARG